MSEALERVRTLCLAFPEATEKIAWGAPTFRVKNKQFAMFSSADNRHAVNQQGGGRDALWVPAPEGAQAMLVESAPDRFFVPPYVGVKGWVGIAIDAIDDIELGLHIRNAYRMVAPKTLIARLEEE